MGHRRRTLAVTVHAVIGLLVTGALAGAAYQWRPSEGATVTDVSPVESRSWARLIQRREKWPADGVRIEPHRIAFLGWNRTTLYVWIENRGDDDAYSRTLEVEQFGAPFPIVSDIREAIPYVDPFYSQMVEWKRTGWRVHPWNTIANTTMFGGASWVFMWTPRRVRRFVRARRGACLDCGYDLRERMTTGCPECGYGREW